MIEIERNLGLLVIPSKLSSCLEFAAVHFGRRRRFALAPQPGGDRGTGQGGPRRKKK